jgi:hypothetical protein
MGITAESGRSHAETTSSQDGCPSGDPDAYTVNIDSSPDVGYVAVPVTEMNGVVFPLESSTEPKVL